MSTSSLLQKEMEPLRLIVQKDTSDRLQNELKNQNYFSSQEIDSMSREDLILNVTLLRKTAGVPTSVKTFITNFDPNSVLAITPQNVQSPAGLPTGDGTSTGNPTGFLAPDLNIAVSLISQILA